MENKDLQMKYDEMHSQGSSSWFSDGQEERETILKMGEPWREKSVLEIGCGEGLLSELISQNGAFEVIGIDYSLAAVEKAIGKSNIPVLCFDKSHYRDMIKYKFKWDRIVMQGVLEHLNHPFTELKWMIDNLLIPGGDVITSSPCFLNPRGIVWMILDMLGAVMSKTDLHYLNPWEFREFCELSSNNYRYFVQYCDCDWAHGYKMFKDLAQRIPLALKDGKFLEPDESKINTFLVWLANSRVKGEGATAVYKIQI